MILQDCIFKIIHSYIFIIKFKFMSKNSQKGQAAVVVVVIIILVLAIGAFVYYMAIKQPTPVVINQNLVANLNQPNINTSAGAQIQILSSSLGSFLVDSNGMTLYYRTNDSANTSNCSGACATTWPPVITSVIPQVATGISGQMSLITRTDGQMQLTYNGWPLYNFSSDKNSGDTNGQGINNVWYVVSPDIAPAAAPAPTGSMPTINAPLPTTDTNTPSGY